jgi:histidyl-tRNA synthetase
MLLEEEKAVEVPVLDLYIAPLGDPALRQCAVLAGEIRKLDVSVEVGIERKLKRMLEIANKLGARYTLIVGDNEILTQLYALKDMGSGEQVTLTRQELLDRFTVFAQTEPRA